jgi:hypothetical protein
MRFSYLFILTALILAAGCEAAVDAVDEDETDRQASAFKNCGGYNLPACKSYKTTESTKGVCEDNYDKCVWVKYKAGVTNSASIDCSVFNRSKAAMTVAQCQAGVAACNFIKMHDASICSVDFSCKAGFQKGSESPWPKCHCPNGTKFDYLKGNCIADASLAGIKFDCKFQPSDNYFKLNLKSCITAGMTQSEVDTPNALPDCPYFSICHRSDAPCEPHYGHYKRISRAVIGGCDVESAYSEGGDSAFEVYSSLEDCKAAPVCRT